jgi:hypothetical protein
MCLPPASLLTSLPQPHFNSFITKTISPFSKNALLSHRLQLLHLIFVILPYDCSRVTENLCNHGGSTFVSDISLSGIRV